MKRKNHRDFEDYLDGEESGLNKEELQDSKRYKETLELFMMLDNLPEVPAPAGFEKRVFKRLGISYVPIYRKILTLGVLSIFSAFTYYLGQVLFSFVAPRLSIATVVQFVSTAYAKITHVIAIIKVGHHLKDIFFTFANPWLFVGFAFVSSILMLILIGLTQESNKKAVLLNRF